MANRAFDTRFQDHRQLSKRQQQGHSRRLPPVRFALSAVGVVWRNLVAIDGRKFKAVNNRDRNFTSAKLKRRMDEIEASISRYLAALDAADRKIPSASAPDTASLEDKIAKLKTEMKELQGIETQLNDPLTNRFR